MLATRPPEVPATVRPRRRQSPFMALVSALALLGVGIVFGFLVGAGAGAIWGRLVPQGPEILGVRNDEAGIRVVEDAGVLVARINPRAIRIDLARGWDQERLAFHDDHALLYFTGPFFEEQKGRIQYEAQAIGDLYFYGDLALATQASREFADRRYHLALTRRRRIGFGYGGWKDRYERKFRVFVGGLGFLYDQKGDQPAEGYSDPYGGLEQRLHDAVPRERLIAGKDDRGHLVVFKTPPRTSAQAAGIARGERLVEAYYLDQGNKARFIVPGQIDDRPRYNLPYLLRIAERDQAWIPRRKPKKRTSLDSGPGDISRRRSADRPSATRGP